MAEAHIADDHVQWRLADLQAGGLLLCAVLFNGVLAIVNAHVAALSPAIVIGCEGLIVVAAHIVALTHFKARMAPWYGLILIFLAFAAFRSAATGTPDLKYFRDVVIIPTFVVLGMTFARGRLPSILVSIQLLVLAAVVLEAISVSSFSDLFGIKSYYINTRGYSDQDFWNTGSDLFVSAVRPDDRFYSFVDLHRLSSIFLEPVSLGNYCVIIFSYVLASYRELSVVQRWILLGGTAVLMVACDGRLATVSCIAIAAGALVVPRLPSRSIIVLPVAILMVGWAAVSFLHLKAGPDDFSGRLAHTFWLLQNYGLKEILGISNVYLSQAADSGLAYLITTQSLFGVAVLWLFVAVCAEEHTWRQAIYKTAVGFYLSLSMLVSFSFLSIKTASLLWFVLGAMQSTRSRRLLPSTYLRDGRLHAPTPEYARIG